MALVPPFFATDSAGSAGCWLGNDTSDAQNNLLPHIPHRKDGVVDVSKSINIQKLI